MTRTSIRAFVAPAPLFSRDRRPCPCHIPLRRRVDRLARHGVRHVLARSPPPQPPGIVYAYYRITTGLTLMLFGDPPERPNILQRIRRTIIARDTTAAAAMPPVAP